jgi:hypothetical protein
MNGRIGAPLRKSSHVRMRDLWHTRHWQSLGRDVRGTS